MKQCIKCGQELEDFAIFCSECGESQQVHNNDSNQPQPEEINNNEEVILCADTVEEKKDKLEEAEQSCETTSEKMEIISDEQIPNSSKTTKVKKSFNKFHVITSAIIVLLVAASAFMSIMYFSKKNEFSDYKSDTEKQIAELEDEYINLESDYKFLETRYDTVAHERDNFKSMYSELQIYEYYDLDDLINKESFLLDNIGLVVSDDGYTFYHTYDCSYFKNCDSYRAFNIPSCKAQGYIECPLCH